MKKKIILLTAMAAMAAFLTVGCSSAPKQPESTAAETSAAIPAETLTPASESTDQKEFVTPGIFKSEETITENERQATFTDEQGNDFIANISEDTEVTDELKEGETYLVSHSEVMTMSLPGIYPQVYKIELSDTKLEVVPAESSSVANGTEASTAK